MESDEIRLYRDWGRVRRLRGIQGLREVDASVMPKVIRADTNATTIMIAEKVAGFIKEGK